MPRPEIVTKADLVRAIERLSDALGREPSRKELADYLGRVKHRSFTENYISKVRSRHGLSNPMLSHNDFIPWTLLPDDMRSKEAQYLRVLGALAQEENRPAVAINKAGNWAKANVDDGQDVRYAPYDSDGNLKPLGLRWEYFPANPNAWHLKWVLALAEQGLSRLSE